MGTVPCFKTASSSSLAICNSLTDFTQALIWSTYTSYGVKELRLFYGNPSVYVPDIANGKNGSYSLKDYFFGQPNDGLGYGSVDMHYSKSYVYYNYDLNLHSSGQFIPRTGNEASYTYVPALSKAVRVYLNANNLF